HRVRRETLVPLRPLDHGADAARTVDSDFGYAEGARGGAAFRAGSGHRAVWESGGGTRGVDHLRQPVPECPDGELGAATAGGRPPLPSGLLLQFPARFRSGPTAGQAPGPGLTPTCAAFVR